MSTPPDAARATIRVDAETRSDALDLAARLRGLHTHLVQLGDSRWLVCVRPEGGGDDDLETVRLAGAAWALERSLESVVHVGDRAYALPFA